MTLRTDELETKYKLAKETGGAKHLRDEELVKEWGFWLLVKNRFPYDKLVDGLHDMVVLKRDVDVYALTKEELHELWYSILPWADTKYDTVQLNFLRTRSVTSTPHVHLYRLKPEYR